MNCQLELSPIVHCICIYFIIQVRQRALQNLIAKEKEIYEQELILQGKTFFKQRI